MNEVGILIIDIAIWHNAIFRQCCVWMELFEIDDCRFRWLQGGPKKQSFTKR
jgi:hypothetical protein